jgi:hypothetical protein
MQQHSSMLHITAGGGSAGWLAWRLHHVLHGLNIRWMPSARLTGQAFFMLQVQPMWHSGCGHEQVAMRGTADRWTPEPEVRLVLCLPCSERVPRATQSGHAGHELVLHEHGKSAW